MPKILQDSQVVYVEPNAIAGEDDFSAMGYGSKKAPSNEDFCIIVDLDVEVKGRTYSSSLTTGDNIRRMEYTSSNVSGEKVKFMSGTKIYLDKDKTKYVTSLTTNYTDTHLRDIEKGGTCEMFGIKSIDINYNNFMVPDVTIQFTDVRGVSLFAQEETRHNVVQNGVTASVNNDLEGSFFKCFFSFPYPKFTLRVKGFYGQMVSYELTCSDWRATFDSHTGSYNVTAKFLGYAFGFLTELMANAVLAAPYSEYIGKDYWAANNGSRFYVFNQNGIKMPMKTFGEICSGFTSVKQSVEKALEEGNIEDFNIDSETKKKLIDPNLGKVKDAYDAFIAETRKLRDIIAPGGTNANYSQRGNGGRDTYAKVENGNSFLIIVDDRSWFGKDKAYEPLHKQIQVCQNKLAELNNKIQATNLSGTTAVSSWLQSHGELKFERVRLAVEKDFWTGALNTFAESLKDEPLKALLLKIGTDETNISSWTDGFTSAAYYYEDLDFSKVFTASTGEDSAEVQQLKQEIGDKMMAEGFAKTFDFPPTVENITRIFMAHVETFIQMVTDCANSVIAKGTTRTLESIGMTLDNFTDLNSDFSSRNVIPPFPRVTKEVDAEGVTKRENAWIGDFGDENTFEEIRLVKGLLKGIENVSKDINFAAVSKSDESELASTDSRCCVPYPITYMDVFMTKNDNPFGKIDLRYPLSFLGHICARAYSLNFCGLSESELVEAGELDAQNFAHYYGDNIGINHIKNFLNGLDKGSDLFRYLKDGMGSKATPWVTEGKNKGFIYKGQNGKYYIRMCGVAKNFVLPIKNWTWKEYKQIVANNHFNKIPSYAGHFGTVGTALGQDNKVSDNTSTCFIYDKDLTYLTNSITLLPDGETKNRLSKTFRTYDDAVGLRGTTTTDFIHLKNKDTGVHDHFNPQYNSNGEFIPETNQVIDLYSVFGDSTYYEQKDITEKAKFFLRKLAGLRQGKDFEFDTYTDKIIHGNFGCTVSEAKLNFFDKFTILCCGAKVQGSLSFKPSGDEDYIRWTTRTKLAEYFNNWVKTEFVNIANLYEVKPKKGTIAEALKSKDFEKTSFDKVYINDSKTGIRCKQCEDNTKIIKSLYRVVAAGTLTGSNGQKVNDNMACLTEGGLSGYLHRFLQVVKEKLDIQEGTVAGSSDNQSATMTLNLGEDSDDIKIGVYDYIKLLYDKWLAGDLNNDFYRFEYMFEDERPTFYFVDTCYNRIGKTMYINMGKLVNQIVNSQTNVGLPLIGMLSQMYADNKFHFMFIQNFADRAQSGFMREMFTPIPYVEAKEPDNHPEYIVLYPYEPSSKLDIKGSEYPDDGFYLNDSTTWPVMISSKRPGVDLAIPAFGVTYGQQYQSYFKDIQVSMESPMATEQSITAKFLIAGANVSNDKNNGPRQVTAGQDLYSIYANNSYTCTVTMMGCAWVQPMMYFVLNNVPMFRGSYQIVKVNHNISAGQFTTTFTGVRMARTATRAVREFIFGNTLDSMADYKSQEEVFNHANANIGNDCEYGYYSPVPSDGQDFSSELKFKLYDHLNAKGKAYLDSSGSVFKNWTIEDALAAIAWQEFGGHTDVAKANRAAVIACMYNKRGCAGTKAYQVGIFSAGWNYFVNPTKYGMPERLLNVYNNQSAMDDARAMVRDIWASGPYNWLLGKKNTWDGQNVTLEQIQKGFTTRGSSDNPETLKAMSSWGNTLYSLEKYGKQYHIIGALNDAQYKNGFVPKPKPKDKDDINTYKENLAKSIEQSLKSTQYYTNTSVEHTIGKNKWLRIVAKGNNATNAAFDCLIQTYSDWFEAIYWDKGNGNMNTDAVAICVKVTKTPPTKQILGLCSNFDVNGTTAIPPVINITDLDKEINPSLKLALMKYFKKKGFTKAEQVKSSFTALAKYADGNKLVKFFELDKSKEEDSIQDCNSLAGFPSGAMSGGPLDGVDPNTVQSKNANIISRKLQQLFGTDTKPTAESQVLPHLVKFTVSTIGTDGKPKVIPVTLHRKLQPSFIAIMNELKRADFRINAINSYDWRSVPGSEHRSNHSFGVAVDINAGKNGNPWFNTHIGNDTTIAEGTRPSWSMKYSPYNGKYETSHCIWDWHHIAVKIFADHGWGWGGAYGDTMHFSYLGGA